MLAVSKKVFLTSLVLLIVLTTGAWQSNPVAAERRSVSQTDATLYPGLTWSSLGSSTRNIRLNMSGDSVPVSGEGFTAQEQFVSNIALPEDLLSYYSSAELAKAGWTSYDSFNGPDGVHYVFNNDSGVYLFVEYLTCQSDAEMTCVSVWKSQPVDLQAMASHETATPENLDSSAATTFGKTSPSNGATGLSSPVTLKWQSYSGAEKYTYCVGTTDCGDGTDWTSTYDTSISVSGSTGQKYYWQVRALTCGSCSPKTWVYADSGNSWTYTVATSNVAIVGNAGVGSATLTYVSGSTKTVTASSTGAYSITVPYNWSGTVTPSKTNYVFVPSSATFTNLKVSQTIQNFSAKAVYYISGNTGQPGVTLSYTDGVAKTAVSDSSGNYTIAVLTGWTGTITPSHPCYTFNPASRNYTTPLSGNLTSQNYTATFFQSSTCKNADVTIGGTLQGSYYVYSNQVVTASFGGIQNGPVKVKSRYDAKLFTSQRVISGNSFNEVMGVPTDQLTTDYWFPYYDNVSMDTWIMVGNSSSSQAAAVDVYIGSTRHSYTISPNGRVTQRYSGVKGGPVRVVSTNGVKIFTSERALYNGSFNEVMGYPANQLTTDYWFPIYDNVSMSTWIMVGNPSSSKTASVNIYVGSTKYSYNIPPQGTITPRYPGLNAGPVRVVSTNGVNFFVSERSIYGTSFNEVMGYPANQLTTQYWFPLYDNVSMDDWILVGNPSSSQTANVYIYIGNTRYSYSIAPGKSVTPRFSGVNVGPIHVVSNNGVNIFTSQRVIYKTSFNEVMGYPANKLAMEYWFPFYDDLSMSSNILIGRP